MTECAFCDWLAQRLGSRQWVVAARWTNYLCEKYDVRVSQQQFRALRSEWLAKRSTKHGGYDD